MMKKFLFLIPILFLILFPEQTNAAVTFGEVGVAFADGSGNVLYEVDKNDYNIELNVRNVKYILMYTDSSTIKNNGYNLFYDFAIGYEGMTYPVGINVTQLLENRNSIQFTPSLFNVEGQLQGAQGYYSRYHLNVDFVASSSNAWYQVTLQLPTEMNFTFYSVYNKKFTQTSGNSGSQIESSAEDIIKNQNENTDKIINNITDESLPDLNSLENSAGWLPPGPVDSIINLPLSLFQNITDNLSKSCQPVILTLPFVNSDISLPCISTLYDKIGIQTFLNWVGVIASALILYSYFLKLYKWVDDTLTFRENTWQDWGGV